MIYLVLAVLCSSAFGAGLKLSEVRRRDRIVVAFANYVSGAVLAAIYWVIDSQVKGVGLHITVPNLLSGVFAGVAWVGGLIFIMVAIKETGIAITTAISRLSLVVPILACILLWGEAFDLSEPAGALKGSGVALAVLAVLLLSGRAARRKGRVTLWGASLLAMLFLSQAAAQTSLKIQEVYNSESEVPAFMLVLFLTAIVFTGLWILLSGRKPTRGDLALGLALGPPNIGSGWFQVLALHAVEGSIVYPVTSVGSVFLLTLLGVFFWKEDLGKKGAMGIALTIVALILINLAKGLVDS